MPEGLGRVVAGSGSYLDALPSRPFVVYIQDAHGNYEGQKNIIGLVRWFQDQVGLKGHKTPFFVEGLVGELDPDMLKVSRDPSENEKNLWSRLEKGEISAASFLSTIEPDRYRFLPLEDRGLYANDLKAFQNALTGNQKALEHLKHYRFEAERAVSRTFSKENLMLYQRIQSRHKRSDQIPAHLNELKKSLYALFEKESALSDEKMRAQFKTYFPSLDRMLAAEAASKTDPAASQKFLAGLESEAFFHEMDHLEHLLLRLQAKGNEEIRLVALLEKLDLLKDLLALEMTRQDWSLYRTSAPEYQSSVWLRELEGFLKSSGFPEDQEIDQGTGRSRLFYEGAEKRDEIFKRQIADALKENQSSIVFLVTGGFHMDPLRSFLTEKGLPHAVVAPHLGELQKGQDLYLSQMRGLQVATIPVPLANDTESPVIKGASLGNPGNLLHSPDESGGGQLPDDFIPQLGLRLKEFQDFGRHLEIFAARARRIKDLFTDTQMGWIEDTLKLGAQAKAELKSRNFDQGMVLWGKTLLEFHRFTANEEVQKILKSVLSRTSEGGYKSMLQQYQQAITEEEKINEIVSNHLTQYQLKGMNVKVKGKVDRGKAVAIGRLVVIQDVNSVEGTQKLNDLHPDDIVVLSDFPTRAMAVECAGIIVSKEVADSAHAVALAREWEVPLFEFPLADVFLKKLSGRPVKVTVSDKDGISFGLASQEDMQQGKYLVTRERTTLVEKGEFAFDKDDGLYRVAQHDKNKNVFLTADEVWSESNPLHAEILKKMGRGIAYRESDDGDLWKVNTWQLPKDDPARKPEAKVGEWYRDLIFHPEKYQVDFEGRVYQGGERVLNPRTKAPVGKGQWYVGIFQKEAVLKKEVKHKEITYPAPFLKGEPVIPLTDVGINMASAVGVKAAVLGELGLAGFSKYTDKGFVAAFSAYEQFLLANNLKEKIASKAEEIKNYRDEKELEKITTEIRNMILSGRIPDDLAKVIVASVREYFGDSPIIIRSSTNLEDLPEAAAPGVYDSIVVKDPTDENILNALKLVWASVWNPKAAALRHLTKVPHDQVYPAGLFMKLVPGQFGGVIYTSDPKTGDFNLMVAEVAYGGPGNLVDELSSHPARFEVGLPGGEIRTVRPRSEVVKYTAFENGRPVTKDVPQDLKNRPVILDERIKREIAEVALRIRQILKREAIDIEFIVDEADKLHILQARYMVQDSEFPVNGWQKPLINIYFGNEFKYLLENPNIGEKMIRQFNHYRSSGDLAGLLELAEKQRRLQPFVLEAIEIMLGAYKDTPQEPEMLRLLAASFETGGFLYQQYGSSFFWMFPMPIDALDRILARLKEKRMLPESIRLKKQELMREDMSRFPLGHFTSTHLIRDLTEAVQEIQYEPNGTARTLTKEDEERIVRLEKNLTGQLERWSPQKILTEAERSLGDDPQRLLWLLNPMVMLDSPKKDEVLSEMFLASLNPYVRKRVLRYIDDENVLQKEESEFQKKEQEAVVRIEELKKKIADMVRDLISKDKETMLRRIALFDYLNQIQVLYPQYGDPQELERLNKAGLLRAPEHILKFLPSTLPQNGNYEEIRKMLERDEEKRDTIYKSFSYAEETPALLRLERELDDAEGDQRRYTNASAEITQFLLNREEARRRAREIFDFAHEAQNGLLGFLANLKGIEEIGERLGFTDDPAFKKAEADFAEAEKNVLEVFNTITDTRNPKAFRRPSAPDTILRDPSTVLKTFREIGHYLNYAQDASSKLVGLMTASKELIRTSNAFSAARWQELPEELQDYYNRIADNYAELNKLLEMSWQQMTYSPFLEGPIYPLPEEARLGRSEPRLDVRSELEDVRFIFQALSSYKDQIRINVETSPDLPIIEKLPEKRAQQPLYLQLVLSALVRNAVEAVMRKPGFTNGEVTLKAELYRQPSGRQGILVRVRDNGVGIPAKDLDRIYDKDFTTKPLGEVELDPLTNQKKTPFGSGLSIVKRQVEKNLNGTLKIESREGEWTEVQVFIPIQGRSLGGASQEIDEVLRERFNIQDPEFRSGFTSDLLTRLEKAKAALLEVAASEPELVIAEGIGTLPATFEEFQKLLSSHRYLVLIDPALGTSALQKVFFEKYGIQKLPERVFLKGFDKKSITSQDLANLRDALEVEFGDRVGLLVQERSKELLRTAGRTFFPYQIISSGQAPKDLVLPLVFHLVAGEGKIAAEYQDYVVVQNNVFLILSLDELVRRILLQSHADRVLAAAA